MDDLKVIENKLVPVYETDTGEKVVYGTELHEALRVKSNYREWINRRFSDIGVLEKEDYEGVEISTPSGQSRKEHIIKLDTAKEMAMLERNEKGKQVRRYFIQVEKKYKKAGQITGWDTQVLLETFQKFMELQTEFMKKQAAFNNSIAAKMESLDRHFPENRITDSSHIEKELSVMERKKYLYGLVEENAELRGISVNSFLHVMYGEIEREFDITLNSYRTVYRSEMGKPDAGMVEVIAANDRFYKFSVRLSEFMIKDYKEQAALVDGMKKFKG